jgi:hypothetical protein
VERSIYRIPRCADKERMEVDEGERKVGVRSKIRRERRCIYGGHNRVTLCVTIYPRQQMLGIRLPVHQTKVKSVYLYFNGEMFSAPTS